MTGGSPSSSRRGSGAAAEIRRVRAIQNRAGRESTGECYVEGIRQVVSAVEGGYPVEVVLVDPTRLKSEVAWEAVALAQQAGARLVELRPAEFERISSRDNPVGIAAVVRWRPQSLETLAVTPGACYLATDDVRDPGNLGTLVRTADGAGCRAAIVHSGVDPAHPGAIRASLGTLFRFPVVAARSLDELFDWVASQGVTTLATTAHARKTIWEIEIPLPATILVGNEGEGLSPETIARCDLTASIPMRGTATSLNVSVAAGIVLYELARRAAPRSTA